MPILLFKWLLWLMLSEAAVPGKAPPWLGRCLQQVRPSALEHGAPLPIDSSTDKGAAAAYGTCAARCDGRCLLLGDFDGDGQAREVAVATPREVILFHDVAREARGRRARAVLAGRIPLDGDEVALLSLRRMTQFAEEVGLLRDGKSPLPALSPGERLAFGLIVWRGTSTVPAVPTGDDDDDVTHSGEIGDLLAAIFDISARSYRLQRVLQLGAP